MLTYIADRVTTNIRELEGALTRVVAYASLTGRPISTEVAEEVLRDLFPQGATRPITIEQIQSAVAEAFHVSSPTCAATAGSSRSPTRGTSPCTCAAS